MAGEVSFSVNPAEAKAVVEDINGVLSLLEEAEKAARGTSIDAGVWSGAARSVYDERCNDLLKDIADLKEMAIERKRRLLLAIDVYEEADGAVMHMGETIISAKNKNSASSMWNIS